MVKDDGVYLRHILDAINIVEEYLQGVDELKFKQHVFCRMEQFAKLK
jgi:uncharacterized protein with HEPN domain